MNLNYSKKTLILILIALLFIMLFSVKVYAEENTETRPFSLSEETIDVPLNGTRYITATGGPLGESVIWSSSDPTIATVNNGTIEGLKIGTTTITATKGEETASCEVNIVYSLIKIGGNSSHNITSVNLVLGEHDTENLYATVEDGDYVEVSNAEVIWTSSAPSVVTVDQNTGTITAVKAGTATITASAAGVSDTCEVTVVNGPVFTDFSNARYELLYDINVDFKISGVTPSNENTYYYIITSNNTKPTISKNSYGALDTEVVTEANYLILNIEENYIYARDLDKYVELNQDLYLWVIEDIRLEAAYAKDEDNIYISHSTKFVVEGEKLTRPELPQLNLILQTISIGHWSSNTTGENSNHTYINFNFPTEQENRKFTLKIGKITDINILSKIQNNDYSGIIELSSYAKNNQAIYSKTLTTTSEAYFRSDEALFDGNSLLEDDAYYFIYVEFDDENGKYYPIQGVTLGQAHKSAIDSDWQLWAYTSNNFVWNNLSPSETPKDTTTAPSGIPNAGNETIIAILGFATIISVILYKKYNKFGDIK